METLLNLAPLLGPDLGVEEKSDAGLDSRTAVSAQARRSLFPKSFLVGLCMLLADTKSVCSVVRNFELLE